MQRTLVAAACGLALLGCTSSPPAPSAPSSIPPPRSSPFTNIVGAYRLTIEIGDEQCAARLPEPLRVRTYDVELVDKGWHFLPVQIVGKGLGDLGGEFWPPSPDARYRFEWNHFDVGGCDYPEQIGSTELYVCGDGYATRNGSTLSGDMAGTAILVDGNRRVACGGSHRFTFLPEAR